MADKKGAHDAPEKTRRVSGDPKRSAGRKKSGLAQNLADVKAIGRYEIVSMLGQGAAGVVFKGYDPYIKREVAIKVSRPSSELSKESFFIEAQSAGGLNHPNIVAVYDFGLHGEYCYITMEYVDGSTLEPYCQKNNLLSVSKVVEIIFNTALALDKAHQMGIIHRDIKPSNILLDKHGLTKIMDFGIAQMGVQVEKRILGTPFYIAPERLRGEGAGPASDVFSLGCVLFEMLTAQKAFPGDNIEVITRKIKNGDFIPLSKFRPDLPASLSDVITKSLAKNPKDRYPSAADLAYELRVALRDISEGVKEARDFFDFVQNVPFFHNFTKDQVRELVKASNIVRVRRDRVIISEGEVDETFFVILSGQARVRKGDRQVAQIGPGECFGEMAIIGRQARTATVEADTDCSLIKISSTLLNRSPEPVQLLFYQNFSKTLVRRLSQGPGPDPH